MRLRWGPYATRLAEQVVVIDPLYVIDTLDVQPAGALAGVFRDLIEVFDTKPLAARCAKCLRPADSLCAYPGSVELIGACRRCEQCDGTAGFDPAIRIGAYEDALRHVALSFRRGHRMEMRRIVRRLLLAKAGPTQATEASMLAFFATALPYPHAALGKTPQA